MFFWERIGFKTDHWIAWIIHIRKLLGSLIVCKMLPEEKVGVVLLSHSGGFGNDITLVTTFDRRCHLRSEVDLTYYIGFFPLQEGIYNFPFSEVSYFEPLLTS